MIYKNKNQIKKIINIILITLIVLVFKIFEKKINKNLNLIKN